MAALAGFVELELGRQLLVGVLLDGDVSLRLGKARLLRGVLLQAGAELDQAVTCAVEGLGERLAEGLSLAGVEEVVQTLAGLAGGLGGLLGGVLGQDGVAQLVALADFAV